MYSHLVSIILPVYNGEKYLTEAIDNCLLQTYENFELIIVNDCSTDSSLKIAQGYANVDDRIKIINNKTNQKLPASLNIGHQNAHGKYITWTSDDNITKSFFLEKLVSTIEKENADIIFSNYDVINENGSFKREQIAGPVIDLIYGNIFGASFLYKKEVFDKLGGYNEKLFLVEDYDFWLRASFQFKMVHLNENLYKYRIHNNSLTAEINTNKNVTEKYTNGINILFNGVSNHLKWAPVTEDFLRALHLSKKINLNEYLDNRKLISHDIHQYKKRIGSSNNMKSKLWHLLRNQWKNNLEYQRLTVLLNVIFKEPNLLFFNQFSRKQTLLLMIKCLRKV